MPKRFNDSQLPEKAASAPVSSKADVSAFLDKAASVPAGRPEPAADAETPGASRLMFALDATMSRQPTWDRALEIQSEMFQEAGRVAGLQVKLVYFRGFGECRASKWVGNAAALAAIMRKISCQGGRTQIAKVLRSALEETDRGRVAALVYVGDCMEENVDLLCERAGQLGLMKVPVFLFQEGDDATASRAFAEIARLSGGVHCRFAEGAGGRLAELLKAAAVYASGGREALVRLKGQGDGGARLLLDRLPRP